jgi:flavorubredoxin
MVVLRNLAITCLLLLSSNALSANDLLQNLTSQLGVTSEQAAGGAGAMFNLAKSRLSSEDFSQIAATVPDIDGLMAAAPTLTESASDAVATMLGGDNGLGNLATLAISFGQLGLSSDMITQFTPIVLQYLQQVGGDTVMEAMKGVLTM